MATTPVYFPLGQTGLGPGTVTLAAAESPNTIADTGLNFTELSNMPGWYTFDVTSGLTGPHLARIKDGNSNELGQTMFSLADTTDPHFPVSRADNRFGDRLATANALSSLTAADEIRFVGPVLSNGDLQIVKGDAYDATDGTALSWESSDWTDLSNASIEFTAWDTQQQVSNPVVQKAGSVLQATGPGRVQVELDSNQTDSFEPTTVSSIVTDRRFSFTVKATFAGSRTITLVSGFVTVVDKHGQNSEVTGS